MPWEPITGQISPQVLTHGTKINCTTQTMNKGVCAMIEETRALPPCRPEPTIGKPTAAPTRLMDSTSMEPQILTGNRMPYAHICHVPLRRNAPTCTFAGRNLPPQSHTALCRHANVHIHTLNARNNRGPVICQTWRQ